MTRGAGLDPRSLNAAGHALGRCARTNGPWCWNGSCSIWSVRGQVASGRASRVLTVDVDLEDRDVIEARGRLNRPACGEGLEVLRRWSRPGGILDVAAPEPRSRRVLS